MILLFTDFGYQGFYVGQVKAVLAEQAPNTKVVDLMHDATAFDPCGAAYLLAALTQAAPVGTIILAVVDPGVGGDRRPLVVRADERLFIGPDNGLFELVMRRAEAVECHQINWRPETLSPSFHGRDLFAPVAGALARGATYGGSSIPVEAARRAHWPDDLAEIIHIDGFGNLITGVRAASLPDDAVLQVGAHTVVRARTFSDVPEGQAFWYENSIGLAEIAVNQGHAANDLGLTRGAEISMGACGG